MAIYRSGQARRSRTPEVTIPPHREPAASRAGKDRRCRRLSYGGKTYSIREWARIVDIDAATIRKRLQRGWTVARVLGQPPYRDWNECHLGIAGEFHTVKEWAESLNLREGTLRQRLSRRWPIAEALAYYPGFRKPTRFVEYRGEEIALSHLAKQAGISPATLRARLHAGWPVERAVTEPLHTEKSHRRD